MHGKLLAFSADKTTSENQNGIGTDVEEEGVEGGGGGWDTEERRGRGENSLA